MQIEKHECIGDWKITERHQIWLYHRIQRCRLKWKTRFGWWIFSWNLGFISGFKVEKGCLVRNSASSWLVQSNHFFCWKIKSRSWLPLKTGVRWRHLDRICLLNYWVTGSINQAPLRKTSVILQSHCCTEPFIYE